MKVYINEQDLAHRCGWEISNEPIDVTCETITEPDFKWAHIDSHGHFHAFSRDKDTSLPTLFRRQVNHTHREPADEDGWAEEWTEAEVTWHCRICEETVEPKWDTRHPTHRTYAPGRLSWRVEVRAVGSNCETLRTLDGQQVSVRVVDEGMVMFGVGLLRTIGASMGDDNRLRWFGCIYGNGALGTREDHK